MQVKYRRVPPRSGFSESGLHLDGLDILRVGVLVAGGRRARGQALRGRGEPHLEEAARLLAPLTAQRFVVDIQHLRSWWNLILHEVRTLRILRD